MEAEVTLIPFSSTEVTLLRGWLVAPHVAAWYADPEDHVEWAANPPPGGDRALIVVGGQTVGYVRWQTVSREILDSVGLHEIPAGSVDVDILIGELEFVGRGIGPKALLVLLSQLRQRRDVPLVGLTTRVQNLSAQRAFTKVGFRVLREYSPPGYGRCYLMVYSFSEDA
ncbi:GNAT family N-acetyltransferase [Trichocoleus sp. FACHB-262]|uniref:GNAT family N-acetyltransferase n=1 Tax=Trichocoleus sp. FACHB-262 TaxID=2692869 RepID=UPI001684CD85|nr:GNAT family N-acetyltransferase [Trichocoleus sp. FACHB-262]MBD2121814.1 GNAT family N-acetyltransferase [Trichocoleus sp. FACHB-262]